MFSLTPAAVLMRHLRWDTPLWGSGPLDVLVSMCPVSWGLGLDGEFEYVFLFFSSNSYPTMDPHYIFPNYRFLFFFGRMRLKKRSEKTEIARTKRRHRKRKMGGGKRLNKKIRSPLHQGWKHALARNTQVHACGAQIKREFQEISRHDEKFREILPWFC